MSGSASAPAEPPQILGQGDTGALIHACDDYSSQVEQTRFKIHDIVQGLGEQLAATTALAVGASFIFTPAAGALIEGVGGGGEPATANAEMGAAVTDLVTALGAVPTLAAAAEAGGALTVAIKNTPDPNVSLSEAAGLRYEPSPKHGPTQRGNIAPAPKDGHTSLQHSVQIKSTSTRRVGVDPKNNEIVIFDETDPGAGKFHGHVRSWDDLRTRPDIQNALKRAGLVDCRGRIIG